MNNSQNLKPLNLELLAPAGNLEKLKVALKFGADAVYFGLPDFSLRARSNQFSLENILEAQNICQREKKKFYITMNIYAHNIHLKKIKKQLQWLKENEIKPNGIIVSDPGIIRLIKKYLPKVSLHLSTQANATNLEAVKFWWEQGVRRVVLAREVTLDEIREIHQSVPEMELEVFIHGAMCMSYSGRCILSKWMTNRSANLGDCAQPCRWKWQKQDEKDYEQTAEVVPLQERSGCRGGTSEFCGKETSTGDKKVDLVDDKNRFEMRVEEDQHGTYMFNSYDISLVQYLDKLINAGVVSFKIEGRAKSVYYVAVITRTYRKIIDAIQRGATNNQLNKIIKEQEEELSKMSNRGYWTGFIAGNEPPHLFNQAHKKVDWEFVGISKDKNFKNSKRLSLNENNNKTQQVFVHNKLTVGDQVEIITTEKNILSQIISIKNENHKLVQSAHGGLDKTFQITFDKDAPNYFLLRKKQLRTTNY